MPQSETLLQPRQTNALDYDFARLAGVIRFDGNVMDKSAVSLPTLRALAHKMQTSGLSSLALDGKAWSVRLTFADRPPVLPAVEIPAPVTSPPTHIISAPMPGTLLRRHPQSQQDFVAFGQQVQANEVVALVQVGPLYVPVLSPASGTVQTLAPAHLSAVQYDEEIMVLRSP